MNNNLFKNVKTLTFISSESCNLNCKYCEIAKDVTTSHKDEVLKVRESLENGSFLTNCEKIFYDYNIDPFYIDTFDLWGQEPTLTLDALSTQMPQLLNWFKNCKIIFFSTNGMAYPERIVNFIKVINDFVTIEDTNRELHIEIQFSIDGIGKDIEPRGADANVIKNNIIYILKELQDYKLYHTLNVLFVFHGVLTLEIMKDGLKNGIEKHWHEIDDFIDDIYKENKNSQIIVTPRISSAFQSPVNATSAEGKIVAEYLNKCIHLIDSFKRSAISQTNILNLYTNPIRKSDGQPETREDIINGIFDIFNYDYWQETDSDLIHYKFGCSTGDGSIKLRYDGTLLYCQNVIFGLTEKDLENKSGIKNDILRAQLKHNYNPNLLTSPREDIEKFIWRLNAGSHYCVPFMLSQMINQMYLLLKNHQIDESYQDNPEKILRHANYLIRIVQCWYNQVIETGSIYSKTLGVIRFYCNGALDIIEKFSEEKRSANKWK